jgi:hypothetical protein
LTHYPFFFSVLILSNARAKGVKDLKHTDYKAYNLIQSGSVRFLKITILFHDTQIKNKNVSACTKMNASANVFLRQIRKLGTVDKYPRIHYFLIFGLTAD